MRQTTMARAGALIRLETPTRIDLVLDADDIIFFQKAFAAFDEELSKPGGRHNGIALIRTQRPPAYSVEFSPKRLVFKKHGSAIEEHSVRVDAFRTLIQEVSIQTGGQVG